MASQVVTVYVWYRCCENMQFRVPRQQLLNRFVATPLTAPLETIIQYQGLGDEDTPEEDEIVFGDTGAYDADALNFPGMGVGSVRALMQNPSRTYLATSGLPSGESLQLALPVGGVSPTPSTLVSFGNYMGTFTFDSWYRPLFSAIAASERYVVSSSQAIVGASSYLVTGASFLAPNFANTAPSNPVQYTGSGVQAREFELPWSEPGRFFCGSAISNDNYAGYRMNIPMAAVAHAGTFTQGPPAIYHAYGDDLRVSKFAQTPQVVFLALGSTLVIPGASGGYFQ